MALFVGGPADGWRLAVEPSQNEVCIAFTATDKEDISTFIYKRECILVGIEEYCIFIPTDWTTDQLVQALILHYRESKEYNDRNVGLYE